MDFTKLADFYTKQIKENLLPFWIAKAIDYEYGGYFTCFDNYGKELLSHDKYTWSQGRMIWILSRLSTMNDIFNLDERNKFLELAKSGVNFLMKNSVLDNGNCTFIMERDGSPKKQVGMQDYDISFYADCFVLLGISEYGMVSNSAECLAFCKKLYRSVMDRFESDNLKTEPYPVPEGYLMHGIYMILLNTSHELANFYKSMGDSMWKEADSNAESFMEKIINDFIDSNFILYEMIPKHGIKDKSLLFERYINPGHAIEDMWFVIHYAKEKNMTKIIVKATNVIKRMFNIGWDNKYGGLFLFSDSDGGIPKGSINKTMKEHPMTKKIQNDWNSKLWWPHSEALYSTLLSYYLTEDKEFMFLYEKVHKYTFDVFPNPDESVGEWIQIRDRFGNPEDKIVALSVKDPFHIIRNFILIIDLLA